MMLHRFFPCAAILALTLNFILAPSARATVTNVAWYRLGENDSSAAHGLVATNSIDVVSSRRLTLVGGPLYDSNVRSSLGVRFSSATWGTNALVSTLVDNFGLEVWVNPSALAGDHMLVYNGHSATSGWGLNLANGIYSVLFGGKAVIGSAPAATNVWTHLALVRSSGITTFYTNGVASASSGVLPNVPAGLFGVANAPNPPGSAVFQGTLDEVRVFMFSPGQFSTNDLLLSINAGIPPYELGATALLVGPNAGSNSVVLADNLFTTWTATANDAWLHLSLPNQSGTSSGNVVFTYDANPGATRSGTLTIAGKTLTVTQAGSTYAAARPVTTLVSSGLNRPFGVAVDLAGNVYFADRFNDAIKKWTSASNAVTPLVSSGLSRPTGVAVDAAGDVYIADFNNNVIKKWTAVSNAVTPLVSSGLPGAVALDGAGNLYIAEVMNNALKLWTVGDTVLSPLITSGLFNPQGVAVDIAGNAFVADTFGNEVEKWTSANGNVTPVVSSGLNAPLGLAVDGSGNVYIADGLGDTIKQWTAASDTVITLVSSGLDQPSGIAVDRAGNLYFSDHDHNAIKALPHAFVDPTPRFESQSAGNDSLPVVLPATANLRAPFAPTNDQPWLTISGITNGVVSFSFTANTGPSRTANITVLGQTIPITQAGLVTPPLLVDWKRLGDGALQFAFSNGVGASFTVLSTTNLSVPFSNWTVVGIPTSIGPGLFQFTTAPATNDPQRFYGVRWP